MRMWVSPERRPGDAGEIGGGSSEHTCFIPGRYRNGLLSDRWTDVLRCAERTFVSYLPVCACGWAGTDYPATEDGYREGWRASADEHLAARSAAAKL